MARERLKSPRARLFVALDLPDEVREGLVGWQGTFADPGLRALRPAQLHMTLVFLGYQPEKEIERIVETAFDVDSTAPEIKLHAEPVAVPRNRPRLFALDAEAEGAVALQGQVSDSLEAAGFHEPEKRPFWPHLTVARVRREKRGSKRPARIQDPPGPLPDELLAPFRSVRLRIYRSYLRPQGAEYVPVADLDFPAERER